MVDSRQFALLDLDSTVFGVGSLSEPRLEKLARALYDQLHTWAVAAQEQFPSFCAARIGIQCLEHLSQYPEHYDRLLAVIWEDPVIPVELFLPITGSFLSLRSLVEGLNGPTLEAIAREVPHLHRRMAQLVFRDVDIRVAYELVVRNIREAVIVTHRTAAEQRARIAEITISNIYKTFLHSTLGALGTLQHAGICILACSTAEDGEGYVHGAYKTLLEAELSAFQAVRRGAAYADVSLTGIEDRYQAVLAHFECDPASCTFQLRVPEVGAEIQRVANSNVRTDSKVYPVLQIAWAVRALTRQRITLAFFDDCYRHLSDLLQYDVLLPNGLELDCMHVPSVLTESAAYWQKYYAPEQREKQEYYLYIRSPFRVEGQCVDLNAVPPGTDAVPVHVVSLFRQTPTDAHVRFFARSAAGVQCYLQERKFMWRFAERHHVVVSEKRIDMEVFYQNHSVYFGVDRLKRDVEACLPEMLAYFREQPEATKWRRARTEADSGFYSSILKGGDGQYFVFQEWGVNTPCKKALSFTVRDSVRRRVIEWGDACWINIWKHATSDMPLGIRQAIADKLLLYPPIQRVTADGQTIWYLPLDRNVSLESFFDNLAPDAPALPLQVASR